MIVQRQARLGDKVLVQGEGRQLTYGQAPAVAAQYAGALAAAGVGEGDRIVAFMSNRIELVELWLGTSWLGAVLVPVNTAFRGAQLNHVMHATQPVLVVTELGLIEHLLAGAEILNGARTLMVDCEPEPGESGLASKIDSFGLDAPPVAPRTVGPGDTAAILYTSGTTGPSKGVVCTHGQFYWWGALTGEALNLREEDVLFTTLPLFHTNALNAFWQAILVGATYSLGSRFSASQFWSQARDRGATVTYLLGAIAQMLLNGEPAGLDRAHSIRVALSPATPLECVAQFKDRFGVQLIEGYGSTETNLVISNVKGGHVPGALGRVVDGFDVRVVDAEGRDVPHNVPGELLVRGLRPHSMASGYFGDPEATAHSWRSGWFHTGDRVVCDASGIYRFVDRMVDAIRRRGENVSSWEVEHALMSHPDVEQAAVIGVPSELADEEVMAFVKTRPGCHLAPADLIGFLEPRLAYFAIPRYWEFLEELPMTENGKIRKNPLRQRGVAASTWDCEQAGVAGRRIAAATIKRPPQDAPLDQAPMSHWPAAK